MNKEHDDEERKRKGAMAALPSGKKEEDKEKKVVAPAGSGAGASGGGAAGGGASGMGSAGSAAASGAVGAGQAAGAVATPLMTVLTQSMAFKVFGAVLLGANMMLGGLKYSGLWDPASLFRGAEKGYTPRSVGERLAALRAGKDAPELREDGRFVPAQQAFKTDNTLRELVEESVAAKKGDAEPATAEADTGEPAAAAAPAVDPSTLLAKRPSLAPGMGGLGGAPGNFGGGRSANFGSSGPTGYGSGSSGFGQQKLAGGAAENGNKVKAMKNRRRTAAGRKMDGGSVSDRDVLGGLRRLNEDIRPTQSMTSVDTQRSTVDEAWEGNAQGEGEAVGGSGMGTGGGGIEAGGVASSPSLDNAGSGTGNVDYDQGLDDFEDDYGGESGFSTLGAIAQLMLAVASIILLYIGIFADIAKGGITFAAEAVAAALAVVAIVLGGLVTMMGLWMAFKEGQKGAGLMLAGAGALVTTGASLALAAGSGASAQAWAAVAGVVGAIGTLASMFF